MFVIVQLLNCWFCISEMVTISSLLVALIRIMCTALPSSSAKLVLDGNIMHWRSPAYLNMSFKKISLPSPWKGFFSKGPHHTSGNSN